MMTFDELLAANHMGYTPFATPNAKEQMSDFWASMNKDHTVSDAEIDTVLETYRGLGVIAPLGSSASAVATAGGQNTGENRESESESPKVVHPPFRPLTSYASDFTTENPIVILFDEDHRIKAPLIGAFTNPERSHAFESKKDNGEILRFDIAAIDKRYIKFIEWLGSSHIYVRLFGEENKEGFAITHMEATDPNGNEAWMDVNDAFLQFVIRRLKTSTPPKNRDEEKEEGTDVKTRVNESMVLSDLGNIVNFLSAAGDTLPKNIRSWCYQNIALAKSSTISPEEQRHAKRALSLMLQVQWQSSFFPSIDPYEARRILDEELYGMNSVKQRIIETIVQINRTHTLPAYGLLLVGPAGTGKSQIAYAVARILKLPYASFSMSTIQDPEALTGSPRIYSNAKPGKIMESFVNARSSRLVVIINELDKADSNSAGGGNPADTLLTLLDGLGFTDNYMECTIPTNGVYPIATANDLSRISGPLMSRFAVIHISDYTPEERIIILRDYVMPKILKRMGMKKEECVLTEDGMQAVIDRCANEPGVRAIEQAAEHIAANTLYQIETRHVSSVIFDRTAVEQLLEL